MIGVVESESATCIEIDERGSAPWMVRGDGAQFFSCNRMPHEDRINDVQGVKNPDDIISEPPCVITRLGGGGLAKPAPRDPNDVKMRREFRPQAVKNVSCASATCEKYEVASGPSPVEHLELYVWLNSDELGFERSLALRRKNGAGYQGKDSHPDLLTHLDPLRFRQTFSQLR